LHVGARDVAASRTLLSKGLIRNDALRQTSHTLQGRRLAQEKDGVGFHLPEVESCCLPGGPSKRLIIGPGHLRASRVGRHQAQYRFHHQEDGLKLPYQAPIRGGNMTPHNLLSPDGLPPYGGYGAETDPLPVGEDLWFATPPPSTARSARDG